MTDNQTLKAILKQIDERAELLSTIKVALSVVFGPPKIEAAPAAARVVTRRRSKPTRQPNSNTRQLLYDVLRPGLHLTSAEIFAMLVAKNTWVTPEARRKQTLSTLLSSETSAGRLVKVGNRWGLPSVVEETSTIAPGVTPEHVVAV